LKSCGEVDIWAPETGTGGETSTDQSRAGVG
jgi:hypothetical protein